MHRLLRGELSPAEAPPALGYIAGLVQRVQEPPQPEELERVAVVVAAMSGAIRSSIAPTARPPRHHGRRRHLIVSASIVVALAGAGTAAAATETLPDPVQSFVSDLFDRVGVSVPRGGAPNVPQPEPPTPGQSGTTPGQSGTTPGSPPIEPRGQADRPTP